MFTSWWSSTVHGRTKKKLRERNQECLHNRGPPTARQMLLLRGGSQEIKFAAQRAQTIYRDWLGKNKAKVQDQMKLFDLEA